VVNERRRKFRSTFLTWDIWLAFGLSLLCLLIPNRLITPDFAQEILKTTNSILSVLFSVYFAALAILASSGDNEFVMFLQSEGYYKDILGNFKITLYLLFIALVISIMLLVWVSLLPESSTIINFLPEIYAFIFLYSVFATINSSSDAIIYAQLRGKFLIKIKSFNQDNKKGIKTTKE